MTNQYTMTGNTHTKKNKFAYFKGTGSKGEVKGSSSTSPSSTHPHWEHFQSQLQYSDPVPLCSCSPHNAKFIWSMFKIPEVLSIPALLKSTNPNSDPLRHKANATGSPNENKRSSSLFPGYSGQNKHSSTKERSRNIERWHHTHMRLKYRRKNMKSLCLQNTIAGNK